MAEVKTFKVPANNDAGFVIADEFSAPKEWGGRKPKIDEPKPVETEEAPKPKGRAKAKK